MPRALILALALLVPLTARAGASSCPDEPAHRLAREQGLPEPTWSDAPAGVFLRFDDDEGPAAVLWLARATTALPAQLLSSTVVRPGVGPDWPARLRRVVDALAPTLADGTCTGAPADSTLAGAIADEMRNLVAPSDDARFVPTAVALAFLAWLALAGAAALRSLRATPRRALLLAALAVAAFLVRWLVAPRLTMVAAQADLGPVDVALAWLDGTWRWSPGDLPPFVPMLLASLFDLVGASLDVAFVANALFGAGLAVAAYQLASSLDATGRAALPAGVAAATLPLAVWYSNGVSLEMPAAVFATTALARVLAWAERRRTCDLASSALATVLFVQCRPEGVVEAGALVAGQVAVFAWARGFTSARPRLPGWLALGAIVLLAAPYLAAAVPYYAAGVSTRPRQGAPLVGLLLGGLALAAALWPVLARGVERIPRRGRDGLAFALAVGVAVMLALHAAADPLRIHDAHLPLVPAQWWLGTLRSLAEPGAASARLFLLDERWFPGTLVVASVLALLSAVRPAPGPARSLGTLAALVFTGVVLVVALTFSRSGEALLQSLRYQVPCLGVAAAIAGVGLARLAARLERLPVRRTVVDWSLVAVAALPAITHLDVMTNVWHDSQREFVFVRDAVARLPERALVLVADPPFVEEGADSDVPSPRLDAVYRTHAFVHALARLAHRRVEVRGLDAELQAGRPPSAAMFFLRELTCYRTLAPEGVEPLCASVQAVAKGAPLARVEFPHRLYAGMSPHALRAGQPAMFDLELVRLGPDELDGLRAQLLPAPDPRVHTMRSLRTPEVGR